MAAKNLHAIALTSLKFFYDLWYIQIALQKSLTWLNLAEKKYSLLNQMLLF